MQRTTKAFVNRNALRSVQSSGMPNIRLALRTLFKSPFVTAGRDPVAGARNRREFGDLFAVRPDAAAAAAGAASRGAGQLQVARARSRDRSRAARRAAATRFSATRCSGTSRRAQTSFTGIAAHRNFGGSIGYQGTSLGGDGLLVSGSYFPVLGLTPALGRLFTPEDDKTIGSHFVVVLSHDYWRNALRAESGDPQRDARSSTARR